MHLYYGYHFGGMHLIWWFIWFIFIFWVFATPYDVPGQMNKKDSPFDILQKRFASGQMSKKQYEDHKAALEKDFAKLPV